MCFINILCGMHMHFLFIKSKAALRLPNQKQPMTPFKWGFKCPLRRRKSIWMPQMTTCLRVLIHSSYVRSPLWKKGIQIILARLWDRNCWIVCCDITLERCLIDCVWGSNSLLYFFVCSIAFVLTVCHIYFFLLFWCFHLAQWLNRARGAFS